MNKMNVNYLLIHFFLFCEFFNTLWFMKIYEMESYKAALQYYLDQKIKDGRKINLSKLAAHCRIQRTYLSKVLNHDVNLNSDQLHLACQYLGMNDTEINYTFSLFEAERTVLLDRKEHFQNQAQKIRAKMISTEHHLLAKSAQESNASELAFYMDPIAQIILLMMTIPNFAKDETLIAKSLKLTRDQLNTKIDLLLKANYLIKKGNTWKVLKEHVHLPRSSDLFSTYAVMQRLALVEKIKQGLNQNDYSFSVLFSADKKTRIQVQEKLFSFLKEVEIIVREAPAKDVYQLNLDFVSWS